MPTINELFTADSFRTYVDEYRRNSNTAPLLGDVLFPRVHQDSLSLEYMVAEEDTPTLLLPTAFNAEVPLRDRIGVELVNGKMPFFREGFPIQETDIRNIMEANASNSPKARDAMRHIYNDSMRLVDSANSTIERMRMQILANASGTPQIIVNANGINQTINYDPSNKYQTDNYVALSGTSIWTAYSTSDPVQDISDAKDALEGKGINASYVVMNKKTFNDLMKSQSLWNYAINSPGAAVGALFHSPEIAKRVISENTGVEVIVYNKGFKDASGNFIPFIADNVAVLIPDGALGETRMTTTPEGYRAARGNTNLSTSVVDTGVYVTYVNTTTVPIKEEIVAGMIALPTFEGIYKTYTIKTA